MLLKALNFLCEKNAWLNATCNFTLLDVASVIISGAALIFAIFIPVRIANRQNKIALFEKRFAAYSDFIKVCSFSRVVTNEALGAPTSTEMLEKTFYTLKVRKMILARFFSMLGITLTLQEDDYTLSQMIASSSLEVDISMQMLPFLFCKELKKVEDASEISQEIQDVINKLSKFLMDVNSCRNIDDQIRLDYIKSASHIEEKYLDVFDRGLVL